MMSELERAALSLAGYITSHIDTSVFNMGDATKAVNTINNALAAITVYTDELTHNDVVARKAYAQAYITKVTSFFCTGQAAIDAVTAVAVEASGYVTGESAHIADAMRLAASATLAALKGRTDEWGVSDTRIRKTYSDVIDKWAYRAAAEAIEAVKTVGSSPSDTVIRDVVTSAVADAIAQAKYDYIDYVVKSTIDKEVGTDD